MTAEQYKNFDWVAWRKKVDARTFQLLIKCVCGCTSTTHCNDHLLGPPCDCKENFVCKYCRHDPDAIGSYSDWPYADGEERMRFEASGRKRDTQEEKK